MKRIFYVLLVLILLLASCSPQTQATASSPSPEQTVSAEPSTLTAPTAEPTATPEPGPTVYSPADIMGKELNPLFGAEFPESFFIEGVLINTPGWGYEWEKPQYHMYIQAPGEDDTIKAMSAIMGIDAEETTNGYINTFRDEGAVTIDGIGTEGARQCVCEIYTTPKYEGIMVHLTYFIEDEDLGKYMKFVEDNFSMEMFGKLDGSMGLTPLPDNFKIELIYLENEVLTDIYLLYLYDDQDAVMEAALAGGGYDWSGDDKIGVGYGKINGEIRFDKSTGETFVRQEYRGGTETPLSVYAPEVTLQAYGFAFNTENGTSVFEDHGGGYSALVFSSPAWGGDAAGWRFEFYYLVKDVRVFFWYYPQDERYMVQFENDSLPLNYIYDTKKQIFAEICPDKATMDEYLGRLYEGQGINDMYLEMFRILERYVQERTGLSFDELVSLPPAEGYPTIDIVPDLPQPEDLRVTFESLGLMLVSEEGMCVTDDPEKSVDINAFKDEWKKRDDDFRNALRYAQDIGGLQLQILYYPQEGKYLAKLYPNGKGAQEGVEASFIYDKKTGAVSDKKTEGISQSLEEYFSASLGIPMSEGILAEVISTMDKYIMDKYSMTPDEFYALDAE